jgi:hypothetical protein
MMELHYGGTMMVTLFLAVALLPFVAAGILNSWRRRNRGFLVMILLSLAGIVMLFQIEQASSSASASLSADPKVWSILVAIGLLGIGALVYQIRKG